MNFFAQLLPQSPVPDKDHHNNDSDPEDEFTVTKGKTLKGFNDDVSQIQLGSEIINDDSMNEIKNQHKLLSGQNESDNRKPKRNTDKSMSQLYNDPFISNPSGFEQYNQRRDSKTSKLSVQSKITYQQRPTAQFGVNLQRQLSLGVSQSGNLGNSVKSTKGKKMTHQLVVNLAELKKLKSQLTQMVSDQTFKYRRHLDTMKMNVQIEMRKRLTAYVSSVEMRFSNKLGRTQKGEEQPLKAKLRQTEKLIEEYKTQLDQLSSQNQMLQQKLFDLQQKIVGVDLQVQQKFQQKRKQLQKKIVQQVTKNLQSHKQLPPTQSQTKLSPNDLINKQNSQVLQNLIHQNQFLQNKIKSYEKILLQTDQIRKMKQSIEQRQLILGKKQSDLEIKKSQIQTQMKCSQKQSVNYSMAQQNLNKQISELQNNLKVKEQQLLKWQQELKKKAWQINQKHLNSPVNNSSSFQPPTSQSYNVTFQKPVQQKLNYRSASDEQFSRKIQSLNFEKLNQKPTQTVKPSDLQTFRNGNNEDQKKKSDTQRFFKKEDNSRTTPNKIAYDPKQHEGYERFDMHQRQKAMNQNNNEKYTNLDSQRRNSPTHQIYDQRLGKKSEFDSVSRQSSLSRNKLGSFKLSQHTQNNSKKLSAQFYQPVVKNAFKYEPHLIQKPSSTPSSQHMPVSRLMQNYKTVSPHRQASSIYRGSQHTIQNKYLQSSNQKSTFSRSSKDNSIVSYNTNKGTRVGYQQGYDMNKSKPKFEMGKLNDLGTKIESLKNQLKQEIDTIY